MEIIEITMTSCNKNTQPGAGGSLLAGICNFSYSGGRDQEIRSSKPAWVLETLSQKSHHKKGLVEWLKV
jgi:hypothetical protein